MRRSESRDARRTSWPSARKDLATCEPIEDLGCLVPAVAEEVRLIELLGSSVWAVALNEEGVEPEHRDTIQDELEKELQLPVVYPLSQGLDRLAGTVRRHLRADGDTRGERPS